jgi:hypothetical protein
VVEAGASSTEPSPNLPRPIYRRGGKNPGNLVPRAEDRGSLSFWESLDASFRGAAVFLPGDEYIVIDANLLPAGAVIFDNDPPGHVSVIQVPPDLLRALARKGKISRAIT